MSITIDGNFYGFDEAAAQRDCDRLNAKNNAYDYEVIADMTEGGYKIFATHKNDDEKSHYYDDGDQWSNQYESLNKPVVLK